MKAATMRRTLRRRGAQAFQLELMDEGIYPPAIW